MSKYIPGMLVGIGLPLRTKCLVRVRHGKWKYKLTEDHTIYLYDLNLAWNLPTGGIETPYYSMHLSTNRTVRITAKKGYAFDGVTAASFLEDPETLYRALWHDIFMQAIYDVKLLPKSYIDGSHKIFIVWNPSTKSKFIYHALNLLHKPWNWITSK